MISEDRLGLDRVHTFRQSGTGREPWSEGRTCKPSSAAWSAWEPTKGVFSVTTSTFSTQAIEFVRHLSQRVILIDGQRLADLMIEHNVGVRVSRSIDFKRVDEDFFSKTKSSTARPHGALQTGPGKRTEPMLKIRLAVVKRGGIPTLVGLRRARGLRGEMIPPAHLAKSSMTRHACEEQKARKDHGGNNSCTRHRPAAEVR